MMFRAFAFALAADVLLLTAAAPGARAAMLYDELFDGDLPSLQDGSAPLLQASLGSNKVRTLTGPLSFDPNDVFEIALPPGTVLESILIDGYRPGPNNTSSSFGLIGPTGSIAAIRLTSDRIGDDVIANFPSIIGGEGPLRFLIGEDSGPAELQVDFVVTPLPASAVFLVTALVALVALRARYRPAS